MISSGPNPVTYFAQTNWRNELKRFGIKQADRFFHMHLIGQTGTGKTTMLETMIRQDIARGFGCCLIDPHGARRHGASAPRPACPPRPSTR